MQSKRGMAAAGRLSEALTVIAAVCRPLSFVHGEGLVHRDLKPSNVFLPSTARAIVADFGLATYFEGAVGRDSVDIDTRLRGTFAYMAPEQIQAQVVDARADLYSIGCILYELLTGQPPFVGAAQEVLLAHVRTPPVPPSGRVHGIPIELEDVVMRLLEKDPARRISYAEDVARLVERLGAEPSAVGKLPTPRPYLYRPRFINRLAELAALEGFLDQAVQQCQTRVVLVSGESGIGKSRAVAEFGARARSRGILVVAGESRSNLGKAESSSSTADTPLAPLRPFLQLVAERCHAEGPEFTARILGNRGRLLIGLLPAFQHLPGVMESPELPVLPPELAQRRFFSFLTDLVRAMSQETPLLLIVDDLQWADDLTLAFIESLCVPKPSCLPLMVLGTFRAEESRPRLEQLARKVDVLSMQRLAEVAVGSVVGDMLGLDEPPEELVSFLARQSEGNPFFAGEYLRTAVGCQVLERSPSGAWRVSRNEPDSAHGRAWSLPLPGALKDLLGLRIRDLPEDSRRMLTAAAVLGRTFEPGLCRRIAELPETRGLEAERELCARQILAPSAKGALRFDHDKIREVVYEELPPEARRALHRAAAEALETLPSASRNQLSFGSDADRHATLGHHWAAAGCPERAAEHLRQAGDAARTVPAMREAARYYHGAIEQLSIADHGASTRSDADEKRALLYEAWADALERDGQHAPARDAYAAAARYLPDSAYCDRARLLRKEGLTWEVVHAHAETLDVLDRAEQTLELAEKGRGGAWNSEWIELQVLRARVFYFQDQIAEMNEVIEAIEPMVLVGGDAKQRAILFHLASNAKNRGNRFIASAEVVELARKAAAAIERSDDLLEKVNLRFDLGFALLWHGSLDEAAETLHASLGMARATGDLLVISRCLIYLGVAHRRRRDRVALAAVAEEGLRVAEAGEFADYVACARSHLGWLALQNGSRETARSHVQAAVTLWRELAKTYPYPFQWLALLPHLDLALDTPPSPEWCAAAAALLDSTQLKLPASLERALSEVAASNVEDSQLRVKMQAALELARTSGYL
jgi:tetratricopeptide (TPR) repeat protein